MPSSNNHRHAPKGHEEQEEIIAAFFRGESSKEIAVGNLIALADASKLHTSSFIIIAYDYPDELEKLAELLVAIVDLPKVPHENGRDRDRIDIYELRWDFNSEWNALEIPADNPERQEVINQFLNSNKLCAELIRTQHHDFADLDLFALWTFRGALEETEPRQDHDPPEAFIPAAAIWISTVGAQVYAWDKEFEYGGVHGDPGRGGPLLGAHLHGFCKERWAFWKRRFEELALVEELSAGLRLTAAEAAAKMAKVESQADGS